jgi:bacteriorhodopsin
MQYTYLFLLFNLVVSFVLFFVYPQYQTLFTIEVVISAIAALIYYIMIHKAAAPTIDWKGIYDLRYLDWTFTTPLMLVSLSIILSLGKKIPQFKNYITKIIVLDLIMVWVGYLGEINFINRILALVVGFIAMFGIFYVIYKTFFAQGILKEGSFHFYIFLVYLALWAMYGVIYNLDVFSKNLITNYLDAFAKAIVGIIFSLFVIFKIK